MIGDNKMKKEKILYIYGDGKYFESNILDWYETFVIGR